MKHKLIRLFFGFIALGVLLGGGKVALHQQSAPQALQQWDFESHKTTVRDGKAVEQALIASGHFASPEEVSNTNITPETEEIPPPHVVTFAAVDGEAFVVLKLASGALLNAKETDRVQGGWTIKSISVDFDEVLFTKDGREFVFRVFNNNDS